MNIVFVVGQAIFPAALNVVVSIFLANFFIPVPHIKIAMHWAVLSMPLWVTGYPGIKREVVKGVVYAYYFNLAGFVEFNYALALFGQARPGAQDNTS